MLERMTEIFPMLAYPWRVFRDRDSVSGVLVVGLAAWGGGDPRLGGIGRRPLGTARSLVHGLFD